MQFTFHSPPMHPLQNNFESEAESLDTEVRLGYGIGFYQQNTSQCYTSKVVICLQGLGCLLPPLLSQGQENAWRIVLFEQTCVWTPSPSIQSTDEQSYLQWLRACRPFCTLLRVCEMVRYTVIAGCYTSGQLQGPFPSIRSYPKFKISFLTLTGLGYTHFTRVKGLSSPQPGYGLHPSTALSYSGRWFLRW